MKTYAVGSHLKCLTEALFMTTHNLCFLEDLWKNIYLETTVF